MRNRRENGAVELRLRPERGRNEARLPGQLARNARPDRRDQKEGMVYDLVAIGRPDDRSLTLLVLTAPVAIQTGEMAAPVAMTGDESLAGAVEPEALTDGTPTPTS